MPNQAPMWWMRGSGAGQRPPAPPVHREPSPEPIPLPLPPVPPPEPVCPAPEQASPRPARPPEFSALADRLRHMDGETLLLLALLWLLWQERADPKLLLALAYIAL